MKIQCNVCAAAEATVLCCADEAALCRLCDQKVHAANKLASKHQRVPLSSSSTQMPKCDVCQETVGYFFCLEDRALLCRKCDVAIHTANSFVSAHRRFLLTGVRVDLDATEAHLSSSLGKTHTAEKMSELENSSLSKRTNQVSSTNHSSKSVPVQASVRGDVPSSKLPLAGGYSTGSISQWQLDEFIDFTHNYNFIDIGSSKVNSGKLGNSDCSHILRAADGEFQGDKCLGEVPATYWAVPQIPSLPTTASLHSAKVYQNPSDSSVFVPDIGSFPLQNFLHHDRSELKRRRHC